MESFFLSNVPSPKAHVEPEMTQADGALKPLPSCCQSPGELLKMFPSQSLWWGLSSSIISVFQGLWMHQLEESKDLVQCGHFMDVIAEAQSVSPFVQGHK